MEGKYREDTGRRTSTVSDFRQELTALLYTFRLLPIMQEAVRIWELKKNGDSLPLSMLELFKSHMAELRNYFGYRHCHVTPEFIAEELSRMTNTLKYLSYDLNTLWKNGLGPSRMKHTHEMSEQAMTWYVNSMYEVHGASSIATIPCLALTSRLADKVVLDFGCGNGWFYDEFVGCFRHYVGHDRPEIFNESFEFIRVVNQDTQATTIASPSILDEQYAGKCDVVWLSQVIHSKEDPIAFVQGLEKFIRPEGGRIMVCGIRPHSAISIGLNTQLRIHAGVGNATAHHELPEMYEVKRNDLQLQKISMFDISHSEEVVDIAFEPKT